MHSKHITPEQKDQLKASIYELGYKSERKFFDDFDKFHVKSLHSGRGESLRRCLQKSKDMSLVDFDLIMQFIAELSHKKKMDRVIPMPVTSRLLSTEDRELFATLSREVSRKVKKREP